jgi:FAD/FMN-containing dehydrogenase
MVYGGPARTSATGTPPGRGDSSGDEDPDRVREAYGDSVYDRLVDVKTTYDPDNVFHHNQNIRPRSR